MIKRIVKLTFQKDKTEKFISVFNANKQKIRSFPGCNYLEVWRSKEEQHVFFTYSFWENETALNNYRHSDVFKKTWANTKILFSDKPEAWTVELHDIVRV